MRQTCRLSGAEMPYLPASVRPTTTRQLPVRARSARVRVSIGRSRIDVIWRYCTLKTYVGAAGTSGMRIGLLHFTRPACLRYICIMCGGGG